VKEIIPPAHPFVFASVFHVNFVNDLEIARVAVRLVQRQSLEGVRGEAIRENVANFGVIRLLISASK
jgi:hypothetical protein